VIDWMEDFKNIELKCVDCGKTFTWEVGEQVFFISKGLTKPKRCPECRKRRHNHLVPDFLKSEVRDDS